MICVWTPGKYVAINKSIINCIERAISFVQYMPEKPIKHGINLFVIYFVLSTILLCFKVYLIQEEYSDNTALGIFDDLVKEARLTSAIGRMLYTNNYYTSMVLDKHMFNKYRWKIVGTIVPTDKKSRADYDIIFLNFSNGSRNVLQQGWYRQAVIKLKTLTGKAYYIKCTTWRDKNQVFFLILDEVGYTEGLNVKRHINKKNKQKTISGPSAQRD